MAATCAISTKATHHVNDSAVEVPHAPIHEVEQPRRERMHLAGRLLRERDRCAFEIFGAESTVVALRHEFDGAATIDGHEHERRACDGRRRRGPHGSRHGQGLGAGGRTGVRARSETMLQTSANSASANGAIARPMYTRTMRDLPVSVAG